MPHGPSHDFDSGSCWSWSIPSIQTFGSDQDYLRWFFKFALLKPSAGPHHGRRRHVELFTEKIIQYKKVGEVTREVTDWRQTGEGGYG